MTLEYILDIVFWSIVCYAIARGIVALLERNLVQRFDEEFGHIIRDLDSGKLIPLTVELHNKQFLCYNSITEDFVCQGYTLIEIAERFDLRYPGRRAAIHRGDSGVMQQLKTEFRDDIKNISLAMK